MELSSLTDNSDTTPTLLFYLYHSKNIATEGELGKVQILLQAVTQVDDLTRTSERILINVELARELFLTNEYEGAMTPGRKYGLFRATDTNITSTSNTISSDVSRIQGLTIQLKDVNPVDENGVLKKTKLSVEQNSSDLVDAVKNFVNAYNETLSKINLKNDI